ncbi:MAG: type II toxin-antitoxin system HicA family toxin [Planctomycetaceae bacterium]
MCRVLGQHGWSLVRIKGSHHAFRKPDSSMTIVVPVHGNRDLKPGTQHSIMKDAELTDADLE